MLQFVEKAPSEEKQVGEAKAAIITALVGASETINDEEFWSTMRRWLQLRPDLASCALLCFGNKARDGECRLESADIDASAIELASLLPLIQPLLVPDTPVMVQHALIGLVRNLSIPTSNKNQLSDIMPKLLAMGVWNSDRDMLGSIQGGAVGVFKNLCRNGGSYVVLR